MDVTTATLRVGLVAATSGLVLVAGSPRAQCQCTGNEDFKLIASDGAAGDWFGAAVALSGDVALVGAYQADTAAGPAAGAAYVYRFDGTQWVEEQKLVASDGAAFDTFGDCLDLDGSVAVVGAGRHDVGGQADAGQVYVYRYDGTKWVEEQRLTASDGATADGFGCTVSLDGNVLAIGAGGDDGFRKSDVGSVYVFRYDGTKWVEEQKLRASDGAERDYFATTALSGTILVVGARGADTAGGADAGAAYVFRFDGTRWNEEQKLTASDGAAGDAFGFSLATDGSVVVIGAYGHAAGTGATYAYRFDGANWVEEQKLVASDGLPGDVFGAACSIGADLMAVTAPGDTTSAGSATGSVYLFRWDGTRWVEQGHAIASDASSGDALGQSVSVFNSRFLVGANYANTPNGRAAGAAYVFPLADLALTPNQTSAVPGDTIALTTCGGLASAPVGLFVVDIGGVPSFLHVRLSLFDAQGTWTLSGTVPSGLSGLTMDFQSYGFFQPARVGVSGRATIAFQ